MDNPNNSTMSTYSVDSSPHVYRRDHKTTDDSFELIDLETAITKIEYHAGLSREEIRRSLDAGNVFTNQWSKYSMDLDAILTQWTCKYCGKVSYDENITEADGYCSQHPKHLSGNHTFRRAI